MGMDMGSANGGAMGSMNVNGPWGNVNVSGHAGMGPNNMYGMPNGVMGQSGGGLDIFSGILNFAIDILVILLVVGLMVALVVFLKRFLQGQGLVFTPQSGPFCAKCGQHLSSDWYCCPKCGEVPAAKKDLELHKINTNQT